MKFGYHLKGTKIVLVLMCKNYYSLQKKSGFSCWEAVKTSTTTQDLPSCTKYVHLCGCRTPLHAAAYSGNVAGLQLVLDQGADVNSVDHCGCSALMVAADRGQTRAVGMLL